MTGPQKPWRREATWASKQMDLRCPWRADQLQECGWKGAFRGNTAVHYVKRTVLTPAEHPDPVH